MSLNLLHWFIKIHATSSQITPTTKSFPNSTSTKTLFSQSQLYLPSSLAMPKHTPEVPTRVFNQMHSPNSPRKVHQSAPQCPRLSKSRSKAHQEACQSTGQDPRRIARKLSPQIFHKPIPCHALHRSGQCQSRSQFPRADELSITSSFDRLQRSEKSILGVVLMSMYLRESLEDDDRLSGEAK